MDPGVVAVVIFAQAAALTPMIRNTVFCGGLTRKCVEARVNDLSTEIARRAGKLHEREAAV